SVRRGDGSVGHHRYPRGEHAAEEQRDEEAQPGPNAGADAERLCVTTRSGTDVGRTDADGESERRQEHQHPEADEEATPYSGPRYASRFEWRQLRAFSDTETF